MQRILFLTILIITARVQQTHALQNQRSPACMSYYGCNKHIVSQGKLRYDGLSNTVVGAGSFGLGLLKMLPVAIFGGLTMRDNFNRTTPRVSTEPTSNELLLTFSIPLAFCGAALCYTGYNYFKKGRKELRNANNYQVYLDQQHAKYCLLQPQNLQQ